MMADHSEREEDVVLRVESRSETQGLIEIRVFESIID